MPHSSSLPEVRAKIEKNIHEAFKRHGVNAYTPQTRGTPHSPIRSRPNVRSRTLSTDASLPTVSYGLVSHVRNSE